MIDFKEMRILIRHKDRLKWAIMREEAKATRSTTSLSKSGGGGKGRTSSKVEDGAIALAIMRDEYNQTSEELDQLQKELKRYFKHMTDLERTVMRLRYVKGLSCGEIADKLFYSKDHIFHIARKAEIDVTRRQNASKTDGSA